MESRSLQYIASACAGELSNGSPDAIASRVCTDSRIAAPGDLFIALAGERYDAHAFLPEVAAKGVTAVVAERSRISAGFSACPVIAVDNTRLALGRLAERYRRDFNAPVIVVGGSNGKTTTKELIASVLSQAGPALWSEGSFNNDIGVPLTLLRMQTSHWVAIVEAGTNHPGELLPLMRIIEPCIGVITNIGREHLEFFCDLDGVAHEEGYIAEAIPEEGVLCLNGDDSWTEVLSARTHGRVLRLGLTPGNDWRAGNVHFDASGVAFWVSGPKGKWDGEYRVRLLGRHQVANALFAIAIGAEFGLTREQIATGLLKCEPAKMRLNLLEFNGLQVLEDCYNANADSMSAALKTLAEMPCSNRRVAVLGDMGELGQESPQAHLEVGRQAAALGVDHLIAVGFRAGGIAAGAREGGLLNVTEIPEIESAAGWVKEFARPGDLILIKASRSMKLERVTAALRNGHAVAGVKGVECSIT